MKQPITLVAVSAMVVAISAGCGMMDRLRGTGDTEGTATGQTTDALSSTDRTFAEQAAQGGIAEVEMAQLAQERASSPSVRQYAERLFTDHSKANQQLMQIAQDNNLDLPKTPSDKHQKVLEDLSQRSGLQFDQRFIAAQINEHKKDIEMFRDQAQNGQDPELRRFAANTVPVLEQHLDTAQSLADQIGATGY